MKTTATRLERLTERVRLAVLAVRSWWRQRRSGESGPQSTSEGSMEPMTSEQRRSVLGSFLDRYENGSALLPDPDALPYDPVPSIHTAVWHLPFVDQMVTGELREITNLLNQWKGALRRWNAWNEVSNGLPEEVRWGIEWEFIEPLAFMCMFQPSAARDRFTFVSTNALHQIRLAVDPKTSDELLGDAKPPKYRKSYPSRKQKEEQVEAMAGASPAGTTFVAALRALDDDDYAKVTSDFRNRASHAIAPRFSVGITSVVSRERVQRTELQKQPDGTYKDVLVPNMTMVQYGYGGTPALRMDDAWSTNLAQFEIAKRCFFAYVDLLREMTASMPQSLQPMLRSLAFAPSV